MACKRQRESWPSAQRSALSLSYIRSPPLQGASNPPRLHHSRRGLAGGLQVSIDTTFLHARCLGLHLFSAVLDRGSASLECSQTLIVHPLDPDLPFLGVHVKTKENHPKHQGFLLFLIPVKTLEKQQKTVEKAQNTQEFPWFEKIKENQNTKEWKIRVLRPSLESVTNSDGLVAISR